jgi:hypothetical protein
MERRGFLGRLLAIVAAPLAVAGVRLEVAKPYGVAVYADLASELKTAYPPGCFDEMVETFSPFYRALKRKDVDL